MSAIKPPFDVSDAMAIKAVFSGEANSDQQRRAMVWIVRGLCRTQTLAWDAESRSWTDFMAGRRFVGLELEYYLTATPQELRDEAAKRSGRISSHDEGNEHG